MEADTLLPFFKPESHGGKIFSFGALSPWFWLRQPPGVCIQSSGKVFWILWGLG